MRNWGINKRVMFLALLPTLLIAIALASYFSINRYLYIEDSFHIKGQFIADNLAPACEYGILSGNIDMLESLIFLSTIEMMLPYLSVHVKSPNLIAYYRFLLVHRNFHIRPQLKKVTLNYMIIMNNQ